MTLIAEVSEILKSEVELPAGFKVELTTEAHSSLLADLWFASYPQEIATDIDEARQEMQDMCAGEYDPFWSEASPLLFSSDRLAAAGVASPGR